MSPAERIEWNLLLAKLSPGKRALVKTVVTAALSIKPPETVKAK